MRLSPPELWSRLRASYWFVPLLITSAAAGGAIALLLLDARGPAEPWQGVRWLYPETAEGAHALLSAIIASMITAISVTFSVSVVALTVAAQHFGARVLNNFVRHTSTQVVLGTFMGTFAFAVIVLGAVGDANTGTGVPRFATMGAVALVLTSVGALIYYVHDITGSLHVGRIGAEIAEELRRAIRRRYQKGQSAEPPGEIPDPPPDAVAIRAMETGYLQRVDYGALVSLAEERGARLWIRREPGAFVLADAPLALVHPPAASGDDLARRLCEACVIGPDRTDWQDAEFPLKQLVEVALRALSPGVNEPFTAVTCIDRLTQGLSEVAKAPPPRAVWTGADGQARVFSEPQPFQTLLRAAFDPIRIFAGQNPAIYARLLDSVGELALVARRPQDRAELGHIADVIRRAAARALTDDDDRDYVESRYGRTAAHLAGHPLATRHG